MLTRLLAAGLLLSGLSFAVFGQDQDDKSRDRLNKDAAMTGCLNKDASGNYTLTDENTGVKTTVVGPDLEKHSSNHKVTLTGTAKADTSGNSVFEVSKIQQVSTSCKAPPQ